MSINAGTAGTGASGTDDECAVHPLGFDDRIFVPLGEQVRRAAVAELTRALARYVAAR